MTTLETMTLVQVEQFVQRIITHPSLVRATSLKSHSWNPAYRRNPVYLTTGVMIAKRVPIFH